jgi:class 3 adenylate cyclase
MPEHPSLAAWASVQNEAGHCATVLDSQWRYVFVTDELRSVLGEPQPPSAFPIRSNFYSTEAFRFRLGGWSGTDRVEDLRSRFLDLGGHVLAAMPGGREELRALVCPEVADLVDRLEPQDLPAVTFVRGRMRSGGLDVGTSLVVYRIDTKDGDLAGVCIQSMPAVGMSQLMAASATADVAHLERVRTVEPAGRHPAAVLMADLEGSSPLARGLSTAQFFEFVRRLVRQADRCVIDAGGIVGRHAGDGVVAYFLADSLGSESLAARSCIEAARALPSVLAEVALRSEITAPELSWRFGLHWGATLYMGRIQTPGRSEVNALGDEMNEAARIEACATGGRTLASKDLIERLDPAAAAAVGIDPRRTNYVQLGELTTATDKARRDAPSIPVCDIT